MSGGPVVRPSGDVIGMAVTGADSMDTVGQTENRGVIPIDVLLRVVVAPLATPSSYP
jgi:hypothetical protein